MPGGVAPKFGSEKVSRYTGVSQLLLRVSRYTVQLRFREYFRKILVSVKLFARNSGAGNGCANFMGAWKTCVLPAGQTHALKIPGIWGFWKGGGSADFMFMGARIFLSTVSEERTQWVVRRTR